MSSYIYTNWRGKQSVIDDVFVEELKQSLIADEDDPEELAFLTPETLMKYIPIFEEISRLQQLEQMWEDVLTSSGSG